MRYYKLLIITALSSFVISCTEKAEPERIAITQGVTEITASFADSESKTILANDEKNILWSPGDEINVFYKSESAKFTSINTEPRLRSVFVTDESVFSDITDDEYFWGTYPYCADNSYDGKSVIISVPDVQTAVEGSFGPNSFAAVGRSKDTRITFYNVCGGIRFSLTQQGIQRITVSGNSDENLAGKVKVKFDDDGFPFVDDIVGGEKSVTIWAPDGAFKLGVWYYISTLPVELKNGLMLEFDRVDAIGTRNVSSSVSVKRSVFGSISEIDKGVEFINASEDLSKEGTANCYLVSKEGRYKFNATVKGCSSESIGNPVSAEVLWESFGTGISPSVGDIIDKFGFINGFVVFSTKSTMNDGNAVIAVKDSSGTILWSWHIWACKDFDPIATAQIYKNDAGTMMDRNLGATSSIPGDDRTLGLRYQWGRKDPFLGRYRDPTGGSYAWPVKSTLTWPAPEENVAHLVDHNTLAYSISHPTTLLEEAWLHTLGDWYCVSSGSYQNNQLWSGEKTMYDPCPRGWRVPDGGENGIWSKAFGSSERFENGPWDDVNKGMNFGSGNGHSPMHQLGEDTMIWYPAAGYSYWRFDVTGVYWSCTFHKVPDYYPPTYNSYEFTFTTVSETIPTIPADYFDRRHELSVRCQMDK